MLRFAAVLLGIGLSGCAAIAPEMAVVASAPGQEVNILQAPIEFQGETSFTLNLVKDVDGVCRDQGATTAPGWTIHACYRENQVWFPLPCPLSGYGPDLLCHEGAHDLKWKHP